MELQALGTRLLNASRHVQGTSVAKILLQPSFRKGGGGAVAGVRLRLQPVQQ